MGIIAFLIVRRASGPATADGLPASPGGAEERIEARSRGDGGPPVVST